MSFVQHLTFLLLLTFLSFIAYHSDYPILINLLMFGIVVLCGLAMDHVRKNRRSNTAEYHEPHK